MEAQDALASLDTGGFEPLRALLLLLAGVVAGFINVNAGGGSLLTLPALLFLGMPSTAANATNRVGIVLQNVSASSAFRRKGRLPLRMGLSVMLPAIPGVLLGTYAALDLSEAWFRRLLVLVMIVVLVAILRGNGEDRSADAEPRPPHPVALRVSFFFIGIYAGFIQAGAGFVLIAALTRLGGLDLIRTNAVKVFVVLGLQLLSLALFTRSGQVSWGLGLVLGAGTMLGGWVGAHVQIAQGECWVRRFLVLCVIAFALKLLVDSFR